MSLPRAPSPSLAIPYDSSTSTLNVTTFVKSPEEKERARKDKANARKRELREMRKVTGERAPTKITPVNPIGYDCVNVLVQCAIRKVKLMAKKRSHASEWARNNREQKNATNARYAARNAEAVKQMIANWMAANRQRMRDWENNRNAKRRQTDLTFVVKRRVRSRLTGFLNGKGARKEDLTFNQVGCSPSELTDSLSYQIRDGEDLKIMQIDHIFPMDAYDLLDDDEQARMMNYTNLQPLSVFENAQKNNKLPTKAMAAKVDPSCWPDDVTMDMLPDIYPGWATPLRMHAATSLGAGPSSSGASSSSSSSA